MIPRQWRFRYGHHNFACSGRLIRWYKCPGAALGMFQRTSPSLGRSPRSKMMIRPLMKFLVIACAAQATGHPAHTLREEQRARAAQIKPPGWQQHQRQRPTITSTRTCNGEGQ